MNNSQFVSQSIPTSMVAGVKYPASVTMKNTGDTTWTAATNYRLGMKKPTQDSTVFGSSRMYLDAGVIVAPEQNGDFKVELTGPTVAGSYQFQVRTVRDGFEWFGAYSTIVDITVGVAMPPPVNLPPIVNAGVDQTIILPAGAALVGTARDPENKPLVIAWTKVSGPGTVAFSLPSSLSTQATFSIAGVYVLRLTASDGPKAASDDVTVTVTAADDVLTLEIGGPLTLKWLDGTVEKTKSYTKFNVIVKI